MSSQVFGRNAFETTLNGAITSGATSIVLTSATGLTAPGLLVIEPEDSGLREFIDYAGISTNTLTGCTRGLDGSAAGAQAHDSGKLVRMVFVHQYLDKLWTDINALEAAPPAHVLDGALHTASGLTIGEVIRAASATTFVFAQLQFADLGGTLAHSATTGQGVDDHHNEAHTVVSHSDTLATGTELDTLTDGSNADALHAHVIIDADALHDNVASEISAITLKGTPISGDFLVIEDSAAGNAKKHITIGSLPFTTDHGSLGGLGDVADHALYLDLAATRALTAVWLPGQNIQFPNGLVSAPSMAFANDFNTGFFVTGNNGRVHWTGNGVLGGYLLSTGVRLIDGTQAAPSVGFINDVDTGFFRTTSNQIRVSTGNILSALFNLNGIQVASGAVGTPSHSFHQDSDSGMYRAAANQIGFATLGVQRLLIGTSHMFGGASATGSAGWKVDGAGTAASPAHTFASDTNLGIYRVGVDRLGVSTAGVLRFEFDATGKLLPKNPGTTTNTGLAGWRQLNFAAGANEILALTSSIEMKEDVQDVDVSLMIAKLQEVRLRSWRSKASADDPNRRYDGIILEEQALLTHWSGDEDISNAAVVPLVAVVQDLLGRVSTLEAA